MPITNYTSYVGDAQRKIVKNDKARENNLLGMHHGLKNPSRKDIIAFHELLCVKEIYKFMNCFRNQRY